MLRLDRLIYFYCNGRDWLHYIILLQSSGCQHVTHIIRSVRCTIIIFPTNEHIIWYIIFKYIYVRKYLTLFYTQFRCCWCYCFHCRIEQFRPQTRWFWTYISFSTTDLLSRQIYNIFFWHGRKCTVYLIYKSRSHSRFEEGR